MYRLVPRAYAHAHARTQPRSSCAAWAYTSALPAQVTALRSELDRARAAALAGVGKEEELRRLAEEKAAKEKEARVEHLGQMAARRLGKKELSAGFETWAEAYWEAVRRRNMLKQAGARLTRPKLIASYVLWRRDWEAAAAARAAALAAATQSDRLAAEGARASHAEAELARLRLELDRARQALAEAGNEDELRRQMEEKAAEEKEARVEHLGQMAARRLGKKELASGWETWADAYWEDVRRRRMLKQAGAKLSRPKLVASYARWRVSWVETERAAQLEQAARTRQVSPHPHPAAHQPSACAVAHKAHRSWACSDPDAHARLSWPYPRARARAPCTVPCPHRRVGKARRGRHPAPAP